MSQVPHQLAEGSNSSSSPGVLLRVASQSQRSHSPSSAATATNNANAALYSQPIQLPLDVNANNGNNPAPGAPGGGSTRTIVVKKDEKGIYFDNNKVHLFEHANAFLLHLFFQALDCVFRATIPCSSNL